MFEVKILPVMRRALDRLFHERRVFGMNSLEYELHRGLGGSVSLEDSKGFLRPGDFAARNIPAETPCVTQSLALREIGFLDLQGFVQISQSRCRFIEDLAKLSEFVLPDELNSILKLTTRQRLRAFHQSPERLSDAAPNGQANS
jgi:hypothetical protein